jgi:hypothetical protein
MEALASGQHFWALSVVHCAHIHHHGNVLVCIVWKAVPCDNRPQGQVLQPAVASRALMWLANAEERFNLFQYVC